MVERARQEGSGGRGGGGGLWVGGSSEAFEGAHLTVGMCKGTD